MKLSEIFTDESTWIKHYLSKDKKGMSIKPNDPRAVSFCLLGALFKINNLPGNCSLLEGTNEVNKIMNYITEKGFNIEFGDYYENIMNIVGYNNSENTTFSDILDLVKVVENE